MRHRERDEYAFMPKAVLFSVSWSITGVLSVTETYSMLIYWPTCDLKNGLIYKCRESHL